MSESEPGKETGPGSHRPVDHGNTAGFKLRAMGRHGKVLAGKWHDPMCIFQRSLQLQ